MITKPELSEKIVSVSAFGVRFMGFPIGIENEKYTRNALMFNVAFLFDESTPTRPYEHVLRKLGRFLRTMEIDFGVLSDSVHKVQLNSHWLLAC